MLHGYQILGKVLALVFPFLLQFNSLIYTCKNPTLHISFSIKELKVFDDKTL